MNTSSEIQQKTQLNRKTQFGKIVSRLLRSEISVCVCCSFKFKMTYDAHSAIDTFTCEKWRRPIHEPRLTFDKCSQIEFLHCFHSQIGAVRPKNVSFVSISFWPWKSILLVISPNCDNNEVVRFSLCVVYRHDCDRSSTHIH